jgi:hydrogenase nickel incorporation protein HypA/HybF
VHELSICGSIADIVSRHADGRRVDVIHVQIGQLRQIVPDTLRYCWELVSSDTDLEGSRLDVDRVRARLTCRACGGSTELDQPIFLCSGCGSTEVDLVAGDEFQITSLELAQA